MTKTRVLAACLVALMLLSSLMACGTPVEDPAVTEGSTPGAVVTETEATTELNDDLPDDLDYGEDKIVILSRYREGWTSGEIAVEELRSEPVNDAVFERNKSVEERLNVKITSIEEPGDSAYIVTDKAATAVNSGSHEYDILAAACYVAVNQSLNGTFADMRKSLYIDFDKPWWSQGYNEVVEYQGAQFCGLSSALLSQYRFAFVTLFNKDLFTDVGQPFLYEAVENGSWTLDKQIELVPLFHQDNGNGTQDYWGDIYGLVSNDFISVDPYWSSCMVNIIQKNGDGDYEMVFDAGKLHEVAEKTLHLFYNTDDSMYNIKHYGLDDEQNDIRELFSAGSSAMATLRIMELENDMMRNMTHQFGVVPMPKFDENQKEYRTLLHDQFTVICVPTTVKDDRLDEMSAVLEALCATSYKTVKPAYYETTLRTKIAQDPQSAEMMDMIIDNIYIDAGIIYTNALSTFHDKFRQIMGSKKNTVASQYKRVAVQAEKALIKMVEKLEKIDRS